jgi:hypothetical protein
MKLYKMGRIWQMDGKNRGYVISERREKFSVSAYRLSGQEVSLPYKKFSTLEDAANFCEQQETKARKYAELNKNGAISF